MWRAVGSREERRQDRTERCGGTEAEETRSLESVRPLNSRGLGIPAQFLLSVNAADTGPIVILNKKC